jgi:hypothetical protein
VFFHESLGEIGYHFLDYHRNFFFGFATLLSVAGVALLIVGAAALVPSQVVIKNTYWSTTSYYNKTAGVDMSISVGLQSLVYSKCVGQNRRLSDYELASDFETSSSSYLRRHLAQAPPKCDDVLLKFSDDGACKSTGIFESVCKTCGNAATSLVFGVAFSALGKFVALFSMQKRMYGYADCPSLKLIGMCTELMGFISLLSTVNKFGSVCNYAMTQQFTTSNYPGYTFRVAPAGVGMNCFIAGAIASFIRFLLHLLTPLPHRGKGVVVPLMKTIMRLFTCKGCCQLYDDEAEDKERAAKHAALHAGDPITPVGEQLAVTHS